MWFQNHGNDDINELGFNSEDEFNLDEKREAKCFVVGVEMARLGASFLALHFRLNSSWPQAEQYCSTNCPRLLVRTP